MDSRRNQTTAQKEAHSGVAPPLCHTWLRASIRDSWLLLRCRRVTELRTVLSCISSSQDFAVSAQIITYFDRQRTPTKKTSKPQLSLAKTRIDSADFVWQAGLTDGVPTRDIRLSEQRPNGQSSNPNCEKLQPYLQPPSFSQAFIITWCDSHHHLHHFHANVSFPRPLRPFFSAVISVTQSLWPYTGSPAQLSLVGSVPGVSSIHPARRHLRRNHDDCPPGCGTHSEFEAVHRTISSRS